MPTMLPTLAQPAWPQFPRAAALALVWMLLAFLALAADVASAAPVDVNVDIIWDDKDARDKCPRACSSKKLYWIGTWRKTGWATSYMCSCDDKAPPPPQAPPALVPGMPMPVPGMPQVMPPAQAGPVQVQLPGGTVLRYDAIDFHNAGDLRSSSSASFEQCAGICLRSGDCGAFTYAADQQNCYLKAGAGNPRGAHSAISGVITARGPAGVVVLPVAPTVISPGGSCAIASTAKCPGCSVTCPQGKTPSCQNAVEGVTSWCARNASCRCD